MQESTPKESPRICFCHAISEAEIRNAVRAGARTLESIREKTKANTGCGGCQSEVERILEEELAIASKP